MVYILLADGFEEAEALVTADLLRRGGLEVELLGVNGLAVTGGHAITVTADRLLADAADEPELLVLPGGLGGVEGILASPEAEALVRRTAERGAWVAAICAAPMILARYGLLEGRKAVIYPGMEDELCGALPQVGQRVAEDGRFVTGAAAGSVFEFALHLVARLKDEATAEAVRQSIHY